MTHMQLGHLVFREVNGLEALAIEMRNELLGFVAPADGHADKQMCLGGIGDAVIEFSDTARAKQFAKTAKTAARFRHGRGQQGLVMVPHLGAFGDKS